jgi:hypothetical protein
MDGYKSHSLYEFYKYYKEEKIIILYIPAYLSHLL